MSSRWQAKRRLAWLVPRRGPAYQSIAVAGRLQLSSQRLQEAGISAAYALSDLEPDAARSIANASSLLRQLGAKIAQDWLVLTGQMEPSKRVQHERFGQAGGGEVTQME
jgi:hypothetical protein